MTQTKAFFCGLSDRSHLLTRCLICVQTRKSVRGVPWRGANNGASREKSLAIVKHLYSGRLFCSKVSFIDQTNLVLSHHKTQHFFFLPISFQVQIRISLEGERRKVGLGSAHLTGTCAKNKEKEILLDSRRLSNHSWPAVYLMTSLS